MGKSSPRKIVYKMMVASPVLLIFGVAGQARFQRDPFETISFSPVQHERMTAYRDLTVRTEDFMESKSSHDAKALSSIASDWIQEHRAGKLYPVPPACGSDIMEDGIRGEILITLSTLDRSLLRAGLRSKSSGDTQTANDFFVKAIEVGEIAKYSDFASLAAFRADQLRALKELNGLDMTQPELRFQTAERLAGVLKNQRSLDTIATTARNQYQETMRREGTEELAVSEAPVAHRGRHDKPMGMLIADTNNSPTPEIDSALRVAEKSQEQFKSLLAQCVAKLAGQSTIAKQ